MLALLNAALLCPSFSGGATATQTQTLTQGFKYTGLNEETQGFKYTGRDKDTRHRWAGNNETHEAVT